MVQERITLWSKLFHVHGWWGWEGEAQSWNAEQLGDLPKTTLNTWQSWIGTQPCWFHIEFSFGNKHLGLREWYKTILQTPCKNKKFCKTRPDVNWSRNFLAVWNHRWEVSCLGPLPSEPFWEVLMEPVWWHRDRGQAYPYNDHHYFLRIARYFTAPLLKGNQ